MKALLLATLMVIASGCPGKNTDNVTAGGGYNGYNGYGVAPGTVLATVGSRTPLYQDGFSAQIELNFRQAGYTGVPCTTLPCYGNSTNIIPEGAIRTNNNDIVCGIPGPVVLTVIPEQSVVTVTGTGLTIVSGYITVRLPSGQPIRMDFGSNGVQLQSRLGQGSTPGQIIPGPINFSLIGKLTPQSGICAGQPQYGWSLEAF